MCARSLSISFHRHKIPNCVSNTIPVARGSTDRTIPSDAQILELNQRSSFVSISVLKLFARRLIPSTKDIMMKEVIFFGEKPSSFLTIVGILYSVNRCPVSSLTYKTR